MPELPEVETVARDLRRHLVPGDAAGPVITGARVGWVRTLRDEDPARFVAGVTGRRIEAVGRRGKQLVIDLDGGAFLTVHLKMTGQLFVVPAALPHDPYERFALALDDGRELRFRDIRKFGRLGLYGADDDPFDAVGPEPLDPRFTLREFRKRIRGRRARLKPLLVDQAFIAGIGNIYADEALWRSKLHPLRTARSLRPADERRLYRDIVEILSEAVERRGSSIDDYTAPDGDGEMQERLDVYQRTGQPCRRCGRPDPPDRDRDPRHALLLLVPATARGRAPGCEGAPGDDDAATGPSRDRAVGAPLGGPRWRWRRRTDARRGGQGPRTDGADEGCGRDATGGGARRQPLVTVVCPGSVIEMTPP